jgi:tryptophan 2,3-dioxygenase
MPPTPPSGPKSSIHGAVDEVPEGMHTELAGTLTYGKHLCLDELLAAQRPVSDSDHELLFIVVHQTTELWMKLLLHEIRTAIGAIRRGDLAHAGRRLARCSAVVTHMTHAWDVVATLSPHDFLSFRHRLETGSGLQSWQYRLVEFALGAKRRGMLLPHRHTPEIHAHLEAALGEPSLYDEAIRLLARRGLGVSEAQCRRDVSQAYEADASVAEAWLTVYRSPDAHADLLDLAERLIDLEYRLQHWRVHHLKTVERIIGYKRGTGGTSGVPYLRGVLDKLFFPELWEIRTRL